MRSGTGLFPGSAAYFEFLDWPSLDFRSAQGRIDQER
jgi:hypothetical protein